MLYIWNEKFSLDYLYLRMEGVTFYTEIFYHYNIENNDLNIITFKIIENDCP